MGGVERDRVELLQPEGAVTADRLVLRRDALERAGDVRREDHVHDVL